MTAIETQIIATALYKPVGGLFLAIPEGKTLMGFTKNRFMPPPSAASDLCPREGVSIGHSLYYKELTPC